jgi:hypothetical protein
MAHPLDAFNSVSDTAHAHLGYFNPDINLADPSLLVSQDGNVSHLVLPAQNGQPQMANAVTGPMRDQNAPVAQTPDADMNKTYPLSPGLVDQVIGAAAPAFASVVNNDKDQLVEQLVPVLVEHPEMFDNVPISAPQDFAVSNGASPSP